MEIEGGLSASLTSTPSNADLTVSESTDAERSALQVLIEARQMIEKEENWTQYSRGAPGGPMCAVGAIDAVYVGPGEADRSEAVALLAGVIRDGGFEDDQLRPSDYKDGWCVADFNNSHTHAEVLAAFDRAIAAERAKEGAQ